MLVAPYGLLLTAIHSPVKADHNPEENICVICVGF